MSAPGSFSVGLAFDLADQLGTISVELLQAAWTHWVGPMRLSRKLAQFSRRGWIETTAPAGATDRIVRLTAAGRCQALGGRDPEACWNRTWDGRWRLVLFDVPESKRALRRTMRRSLRTMGFGYLQHSAWISPDPVARLKATIGTAHVDVESLSIMEARPCGGETDAQLVVGAWDLDWVNKGYKGHRKVLDQTPGPGSSRQARLRWLETEWRAWQTAVHRDPLLPAVLLPSDYQGCEALRRRNAILAKLLRSW